MADPFGRAIRDFFHDDQVEPLLQIDGGDVQEHPIEQFYFDEKSPDSAVTTYQQRWLDGPLLDLGAGVGRDALFFQERTETVALEISEPLVRTMRDRGVDNAREGDMFSLRSLFDSNRFRSVLSYGTQLGLARSMARMETFFQDLAHITQGDATALVDNYDPDEPGTADLLGYRDDESEGLGFRVFHFEYEGDVGPTLLFRLLSPDRLRTVLSATPWEVADVRYGNGYHYAAVVTKQ